MFVAEFQPPPLIWQTTLLTCQLSLAVPLTVNTALLTRWPAVRLVMLTVGLFVSTKFACKVRFEAIMNVRFVPVTFAPPIQLVEMVQLVNTKPLAGVEVML